VHRLIDDATTAMDNKRFNVAIARLMELTSALRKAFDSGFNPAVREGTEALVRMVSCFAPFSAEDAWRTLGHRSSVMNAAWPDADQTLLVETRATCVIQVSGKVRDKIEVPIDIADDELRRLALRTEKIQRLIGGRELKVVIVKAPNLVSIVPA